MGRAIRWALTLTVATLAATAALAEPAVGGPGGSGNQLWAGQAFRDGSRRVVAVRLSAQRGSMLGRVPVLLRYEDGREFKAQVGETALIQLGARSVEEARQAVRGLGIEVTGAPMSSIGIFEVRGAADEDGLDVAERLQGQLAAPGVLREAIPNLYLEHKHFSDHVPNDPMFGGQWYFDSLKMAKAWGITEGDPSVTIVVVDNGCDIRHPDLKDKLDTGRNVLTNTDDPSFEPNIAGNMHGTACAGLVGATTDNSLGIAGGCPKCRVRCVKMLSDTDPTAGGAGADIAAFDFALQVNAAVVSNSWGFADAIAVPSLLAKAINNVYFNGRNGKGALVLFAAGNDNRKVNNNELLAVEGVLGIGAVNRLDEATQFTNYGDSVDLVAPTGTATTDISGPDGESTGDYFQNFGGTSSACPVAAGIAGLLASAAPDLTSQRLYDVLTRTARVAPLATPDPKGHDPVYGYGIIDPVAALEMVVPPAPDAGIDQGGGGDAPKGCGCSSASASPLLVLGLAWLGLAGVRRRK